MRIIFAKKSTLITGNTREGGGYELMTVREGPKDDRQTGRQTDRQTDLFGILFLEIFDGFLTLLRLCNKRVL